MLLYKYFSRTWGLAALQTRLLRFTQPAAFNDPFEFSPVFAALATKEQLADHIEEALQSEQVAHIPAFGQAIPAPGLRDLFRAELKARAEALITAQQAEILAKVREELARTMNSNSGLLCLSEVRDSLLMWGHYTDCHQGLVIGFDSKHAFFSTRRGPNDEFGYLRQVVYKCRRPNVVLLQSDGADFFQTKSSEWAYEREWRIMRHLAEETKRVDGTPYPACLFEFPADAVKEVIVGMRADAVLVGQVHSLMSGFPGAALYTASAHPTEYKLVIGPVH